MQTLNTPVQAFPSVDGITSDGYALDGTHTFTGSFFTVPVNVSFIRTISVQFNCTATGSPSGTLVVQGCNDKSAHLKTPDVMLINWSTMSFWDEASGSWLQSKTVSGAANFVMSCPVLTTQWVRLSWTNSSGNVAPTIKLMLKE